MTSKPASKPRNLCLFDLDDTLLPLDSDHAWGVFVTGLGWVDPAEFGRLNEHFYAQYRAAAARHPRLHRPRLGGVARSHARRTRPRPTGASWPRSSSR